MEISKKKLIGIIIFFLATLSILIYLIINSLHKETKVSDKIRLTREVILRTEMVFSMVKDIEASSRGFALTNSDEFLQAVNDSRDSLRTGIPSLKMLTRGDDFQQRKLDSLNYYIDKKIVFCDLSIAVRKNKGLLEAYNLVATGEGVDWMNKIRHIVATMQDYEGKLLNERRKLRDTLVERRNIILIIAVGLLISVSLVLLLRIFNDYRKSKRLNEDKLQIALEAGKIGVWEYGFSSGTSVKNKRYDLIFGYKSSPDQWGLEIFYKHIHEADRTEVMRTFDAALTSGSLKFSARVLWPDGAVHWIRSTGKVLRDEKGVPVKLLATVVDFTDEKRANEEIAKMNEELHSLSSHLIKIREDERIRIAREIHDQLGQQLAFLKMETNWINKRIDQNDEMLVGKFHRITEVLNHTIKTVRKISSELRPSVLDNLGILQAIEWHSKEFTATTAIPVRIISNLCDVNLPKETATALFRVYQESLTNIMKHAEASTVFTSLTYADDVLELIVTDNGKGFIEDEVRQKHTLGLVGIKERIYLEGGTVKIFSEPGNGTTVRISLPCNSAFVTVKNNMDAEDIAG
jgi:signal transduction histidine kinase